MKRFSRILLSLGLAALSAASAAEFKVEGTSFVLDGKPFQIRSGEIHYSRVPKEEWRNRIRMAKAMGLNTICTYVFWNFHETRRGEYDFTGEKDVAAFVKLCGEEGMQAIVRPGPYVCAEWDLGGIPAWLLAEPGIKLRTTTPRFLDPAKAWMKHMGRMLQPLSITNGGPLLMVQVENEYGHFGDDPKYMDALYQALRSGGYQGIVFTSGGPSQMMLQNGALPGQLNAVNFGGGGQYSFGKLREFSPKQPDFTAEFWVGWYDQWEMPHHAISVKERIGDLQWMMEIGASFNIYMFHGGTTRGLWAGGDFEGRYRSITCCHDWDAPLDESGRPTEKYHAFRAVIQKTLGDQPLPEIPKMPDTGTVGDIQLTEKCGFLDSVQAGPTSTDLETMEDLGQTTGFVLYRTQLQGPLEGSLALDRVKDRVYVILNGKLQAISGRTGTRSPITLKIPAGENRLELLVENMGRISYGTLLPRERRGLEGPVSFAGKELGPFEIVGLPMQDPPKGNYQELAKAGTLESATLYRGRITTATPCDTWLDMRGFGRGMVWFNGRNLGRYWKAGPPRGIFLPGCWMKTGSDNEIVVLELESETCPDKVPTSAEAIWDSEHN